MAARVSGLFLVIVLVGGCAVYKTPPIKRIALLAPFEGRYREVGYQALYAARMAIADTERIDLELLAVDDGGSPQTALDRAHALNNDPLVKAVIVLGIHAADENVLNTLEPRTFVVGQWNPPLINFEDDNPPTELTDIAELSVPYICGDVCLLESFVLLTDDPTQATIQTLSPSVDESFRERYINFDLYVPEPLPFAKRTYDTTQQVIAYVDGEVPARVVEAKTWTYRYTPAGELQTVTP